VVVAIMEERITCCNHPDKTTPHREECGAAKEGKKAELNDNQS
jgi:hypothetical protein